MARQEFKVGQEVMVRWYDDNWQKKVVVSPVGHKTGWGWDKQFVTGEPQRGGRAYVEVKFVDEGRYPYTSWVVNSRNKILSLEDYEPIAKAQERLAIARAEQEETVERAREVKYLEHAEAIKEMARAPWVNGTVDDLGQRVAEYLKQHFTLS